MLSIRETIQDVNFTRVYLDVPIGIKIACVSYRDGSGIIRQPEDVVYDGRGTLMIKFKAGQIIRDLDVSYMVDDLQSPVQIQSTTLYIEAALDRMLEILRENHY